MGWLSDRYGRRARDAGRRRRWASSARCPFFWLMHQAPSLEASCWASSASSCRWAPSYGGQPALMVEAVPAEIRCTAIALGYNVTLGMTRRLQPAGGHLARPPDRQRLQPGLHDHGGGRRLVRRHPEIRGNLPSEAASRLSGLQRPCLLQLDAGLGDQLAEQVALAGRARS